jgi:hypothetical protein
VLCRVGVIAIVQKSAHALSHATSGPRDSSGRSRSRAPKVRNFFGIELNSNAEISHRG